MIQEIVELLFSPKHFFSKLDLENVDLKVPAIIVGFPGLFTIITFFGPSPTSPLGYILIMGPLRIVSEIIALMIIWGMATVILLGLSMVVSGTGSFERTLQNTGYGMLPISVFKAISIMLSTTIMLDPGIISIYSGFPSDDPLWLTTVLEVPLTILGLLWSGYLWISGISHAQKISVKKSLIVVAVFECIAIVAVIWPLLLMVLMNAIT